MAARFVGALALLLLAWAAIGEARAAVLDRLRGEGTIRLAWRADAAPFSSRDTLGEPVGYSVELCRQVAKAIAAELGRTLEVSYVEVTATDRLQAVQDGRADLLCEATSMTLGRMAEVDFSLPTFITGGSLLYRADGPSTFEGLAGHDVGVLDGTTTEENLRRELARVGSTARIVPVTSHDAGLAALEKGEITAYFADRAILVYLYLGSREQERLKLASVTLSLEPYALALPKNDPDFRLAVDRSLARFYRQGGGQDLFHASFPGAELPEIVRTLYLLNAIPE